MVKRAGCEGKTCNMLTAICSHSHLGHKLRVMTEGVGREPGLSLRDREKWVIQDWMKGCKL